ncbi:MAG: hypothetical protein HY808_00530 [Nitrospirae bacterium]|nr:hypothetical protein [Nitrospirota bacterium]
MSRARSIKIILLTAVVVILSAMASHAVTVPQMINYSGTLNGANGQAAPNGNYSMEFRIYNAASGGVVLYTEKWDTTTSQVPVVNGTFNVMLGAIDKVNNPIPANFFQDNPETFLGIKVGNDSEMLPRQKITSVGYSFSAGNGVPKGGIIMWSGSVADIPAGWALCDGANGTPNLRDRFVVGAGSGYAVGASGGYASINLQHSHSINNHTHTTENHTLTINEMPSHNHGGTTGDYPMVRLGQKASSGNNEPVASQSNNHNHSIPLQGGDAPHNHGNTGTPGDRGTDSQLSGAQDIRPPYYALAFIMKL